ncbi:WecB/TagA/CpsF family glycosyltransferase [Rhodobacteraceae bacterium LMO-12]|nr:WecB/TagA/CpsF family glycosyltransferase [Rhodobacteraceae bacterium LMO-JJ12]
MEFRFGKERVTVNFPNRDALVDEVCRRFRGGEGFALATLNLDHLVKLRASGAFRRAYGAQDLVVADGNPIVWLSRLAGRKVELVPGSDMVLPLAEVATDEGVRVALVGSTEESLVAAGTEMTRVVPGLEIVAKIAPPMGFDADGAGAEEVFAALESSGARLVFIALGAPKQELFAAKGRERLPGVGFASIGAGLDFLSGSQERAPKWVRAMALEWLWRMLQAPGRMGLRYAKCFAILPRQMVEAVWLRFR